jgi:hypothetical protein
LEEMHGKRKENLHIRLIEHEKHLKRKREDGDGKGEIGEGGDERKEGVHDVEQQQQQEFVPTKKRKVVWSKHTKFLYDGDEMEDTISRPEEDDGGKRASGWEGEWNMQGRVKRIAGKSLLGQKSISTYRKVDELVRFGQRNNIYGLCNFRVVIKATEGAGCAAIVGDESKESLELHEQHPGKNGEETYFRLRELPAEIRRMIFMFALVDEDKVKKLTRTKTVREKKERKKGKKKKKGRRAETIKRTVEGDSEPPLLEVLMVEGWMDVWQEARDVYYTENRWMISVSRKGCDDKDDGEEGDENMLELMRKVVLVVP